MFLYEKVGHSKLVEMHWDVFNFYRFASQSDWYFILATGLKLRSIYRTVTCRCERKYLCSYEIDFELHYFIPLLQSDLRSDK